MIEERELAQVDESAIKAGTSAPIADGSVSQSAPFLLYFLNEDATELVPQVRTITYSAANEQASAVLRALLNGPTADERNAEWPSITGTKVQTLKVSDNTAIVELPSSYESLEPQVLYAVRSAIARTLNQISGISYVDVLVSGHEPGMTESALVPAGTFSRTASMETGEEYALIREMDEAQGYSRLATLYIPRRGYLVAEPHLLVMEETTRLECLYQVLNELTYALEAEHMPGPMSYIAEMPDISQEESGSLVIRLHFRDGLRTALRTAELDLRTYLAMLTHSLLGFVPGVNGLQVDLAEALPAEPQDEEWTGSVMTRADFPDEIGTTVTVYLPNEEGKLKRMQTVTGCEDRLNPRAALRALLRESPSCFAGLVEEDVLAIRIERENLVINLSRHFRDVLEALPEGESDAAVYALVNTVTENRREEGVIFFFDGEQIPALAGGLVMRGRLIRNPGLVEAL